MSDNNSLAIAQKYVTALQESYLANILCGKKPLINLSSLEADRRKHSKLARELVNLGLIKLNDPESYFPYLISKQVLDALPIVEVDLCQVWKNRLDCNATAAEQRPWIRMDRFDASQKKAILKSELFDYFVVSREAYSSWSKFADARATLMDDTRNRYEQYWDGPLETILDAFKIIGAEPTLMLAVSSPALRTFVEAELQARKFAELYLGNALWGLVECGIIESHLVFDEHDQPLIHPHFQVPTSPFLGNSQHAPASPADWPTNLSTSITHLETQLASLTQRLTTMQLIAQGIDRYGGWNKFQQDYSAKLTQHMATH